MYQIRKFLTYIKIDWLNEIKLPKDPEYSPKKVSNLKNVKFDNKKCFLF